MKERTMQIIRSTQHIYPLRSLSSWEKLHMKGDNIKTFFQGHKNSSDKIVNPQVYYERIRIHIITATIK
jgi:ribosomal protein S3AE